MGEIIIGHKDRQIWSPSHVLQDPLFDHSTKHQLQKSVKNHHHYHNHNHGNGGFRLPGAPPLRETFSKNYNSRQKQQSNWQRSKGEDRMQAFFLVSPGRTTSGTGVFLPATASHTPTKKKSACSPVLLPTRVVQALNLNIHNNGIHISPPHPDIRENNLKKKSEMLVMPMKIEGETPIDSPEKLLPDEWIY
ncbi:PREDICTED: uncharacterized protein LOC104737451 isoform X1 [Camelina sativa]|uniref:Uncharacterized protein LOC104737451 isoform X1 n=1 Tax=Camelina sativa TaxID=90675 RepID=A0ABM0VGT4_CAMSA|nr:PREDICTED: uncharacterized protein LOC104737451 isoform X1 [Camelina sativa]